MDPPEAGMSGGFGHGGMQGKKQFQDGWRENRMENDEQTLTFNNQDDDLENDLFAQRMLEQIET